MTFYFFANIILVGGMNGLGMVVTKYASAANRVTLQQSKTVLVWIFFLVIPISRAKETFYGLQLGGFIVMLIGVILYNEIIELPIFGFNLYTKNGLAKTQLRGKSINDADDEHLDETAGDLVTEDATNYMPTSPSRYDYQKNYRRLKDKMEGDAGKGDSNEDYMKIDGMD